MQVAQLLGDLQLLFDFFAVMSCDSKTKAAHRDVPPYWKWDFFWRNFPDVPSFVNPFSENRFLKVYSYNALALTSPAGKTDESA
jgi:hypothetical protein